MNSGTHRRPIRECRRCHEDRPMQSRGMCTTCYDIVRNHGELNQWPTIKPDRQAQVRELLDQGIDDTAEIARRLGCSIDAASSARTKVRAEQPLLHWWEALAVPPPPTPVPCAGKEGLFDVDFTGHREVQRAGRLLPWIEPQIEAAFRYCAACPLATREWCVREATLPGQSRVNIIAGGAVWANGRQVWTLDDHLRSDDAAAMRREDVA